MPKIISLISIYVKDAILQLFFFAKSCKTKFFNSASTFTHSSSVKVGQIWFGFVITFLFGLKIALVFSKFTCSDLKIKTNLEKAVKLLIELSQSSYKLNTTIYGSVAFKIKSPNFSIFKHA